MSRLVLFPSLALAVACGDDTILQPLDAAPAELAASASPSTQAHGG